MAETEIIRPRRRHLGPTVCTCGHEAEGHFDTGGGWWTCWGYGLGASRPCPCRWLDVLPEAAP